MSDPSNSVPVGGDQDRGPQFIAIAWTECIIACIFVALRFHTRVVYIKRIEWDDWIILLTMPFVVAHTALWTVIARDGGGRHSYYLPVEQQIDTARLQWISHPITVAALAMGRISVALFLLRLIGLSRWKRISLHFIILGTLVAATVAIIAVFVRCSPVQKLWNPGVPGRCRDPLIQEVIAILVGSYFSLTDFLLAVIPMTIVRKLQASVSQKVALIFLLGFSVVSAIAAAIKTSKIPLLTAHNDITYTTISTLTWASTECFVIIVVACIPTLRPLFRDLIKKAGFGAQNQQCVVCGEAGDGCDYCNDSNIRGRLKTIHSWTSSQDTLTFNQPTTRIIPIRQTSGSTIQTIGSDEYGIEPKPSKSIFEGVKDYEESFA